MLACSDYFTDRGEFAQALALYAYKPSMQGHQDFYSRMAYVSLKNEHFSQATGSTRGFTTRPKNARWWLVWAGLTGSGDAKLAHDAYAKAYKYAQPGAGTMPFCRACYKMDKIHQLGNPISFAEYLHQCGMIPDQVLRR